MHQKIAIQGVKGAFHEEAARQVFGNDVYILPCATFEDVARAVAQGKAEAGIIAVENTISGTIISNLELIQRFQLVIVAETFLRIRQNLAALKGSDLTTLREVHSHYMAINQCRDFFAQYPHIRLVESSNTALSIREVAEKGDKTRGAIGSTLAIEYYGLEPIAENIETDKLNFTRFLVVQQTPAATAPFDKVSTTIVLPHIAGALSKILSLFYLLGINLTKIESMPIIGKPWQYRFYIDFILSKTVSYEATIEALTPLTEELVVLGQYEAAHNGY